MTQPPPPSPQPPEGAAGLVPFARADGCAPGAAAAATDETKPAPGGPSIRRQLALWMLLASLLPLLLALVLTSRSFADAIEREALDRLQGIADRNASQIDGYVAQLLADAEVLAAHPASSAWLGGARTAARDDAGAAFGPYARRVAAAKGVHDVWLLDADGRLLQAGAPQAPLGMRLSEGALAASELPAAVESANTLLQTTLSNFGWYALLGRPTAFVVAPVFGSGRVLGNVVLVLDNAVLFQVVNNYVGLGETGEIVVGYRRRDQRLGVAAGTRLDAALEQKAEAATLALEPLPGALRGDERIGRYTDYRGVPVLAASKYLPTLDWAMVVKIDEAEVMQPVRRFEQAAAVLLAVLLLVIAGALWATWRAISRPITQLAGEVAAMDDEAVKLSLPASASREIAQLVEAFNRLAGRLQAQRALLEQRVAERTVALADSRAALEQAQQLAQVGSWQLRRDGPLEPSGELERWLRPAEAPPPAAPRPDGAALAAFEPLLARADLADRALLEAALARLVEQGRPFDLQYRWFDADGTRRFVRHVAREQADGVLQGAVLDLSDLRSAQQRVEEYLRIINDNVITSSRSPQGLLLAVSDAFCRATGYSRDELLGKDIWFLLHPDTPVAEVQAMTEALASGRDWSGELRYRTRSGGEFWVRELITPSEGETSTVISFTAIHEDISDRKRVEKLSVTDDLTGLYNRRSFREALANALQQARQQGWQVGLLLLDIDYFKRYNDSYGHAEGDRVLTAVAQCLRTIAQRGSDLVFRIGGEEFAVLLQDSNAVQSEAVAAMLVRAVAALRIEHRASFVEPQVRVVTVSVGLALSGSGAEESGEQLYREADTALYAAKDAGRNTWRSLVVKPPPG
jgi:diguanylate cyclase (GGDEF)-like protein/PAS domain S-box-containing protein